MRTQGGGQGDKSDKRNKSPANGGDKGDRGLLDPVLFVSRLSPLHGPCIGLPNANEPASGEALGGAGKGFLPTSGLLTAKAAAVCVGAPLIEGDNLHTGRNVRIGDTLSAVGDGLAERIERELGVLWYLRRSLCALAVASSAHRLGHHRSGDRIAIASSWSTMMDFWVKAMRWPSSWSDDFTTSASRVLSLLTTWMVVSTAPSSAPWPRMRSLPSTG